MNIDNFLAHERIASLCIQAILDLGEAEAARAESPDDPAAKQRSAHALAQARKLGIALHRKMSPPAPGPTDIQGWVSMLMRARGAAVAPTDPAPAPSEPAPAPAEADGA